MKSFPKDMPEWQAIQDTYNAGEQPQIFRPEEEMDMSQISNTPANYNQLAQTEAQEQNQLQDLEMPSSLANFQGAPQDRTQDDMSLPTGNAPQAPVSRAEQLWQEYSRLVGEDRNALKEARNRDRMLKVGGAVGDTLATLINAQNQMSVKAPGVQVQKGAGLDKIADIFARSPEIESDLKARREDLLAQYKAMAEGDARDLQRRRVSAYEDQVKAMAKKNTASADAPSFEEKEKIKANVKENIQINKENRKLKEELEPALATVNEQIENAKTALKLMNDSKLVGTGPVDQYVASVSPEGQLLKKALGNISLDTLVQKFQGMSRAIDTETDRKFFQETQPSMSNFETTNKKMIQDILKRLEGIKERSERKLKEINSNKSNTQTHVSTEKKAATPGQIVKVGNKRFRVAEDGDTLIPLEN